MIGFFHVATHLGGAEQSFLSLARSLKKNQIPFITFVPKDKGPLIDELNHLDLPWVNLKIPSWLLKTSRRNKLHIFLTIPLILIYLPSFLIKTHLLLKKKKIKTIHCTGLKIQILIGFYGCFVNKKIRLHIRDCINSTALNLLFRLYSFRKNLSFIANSKMTAQSLLPTPSEVIYNGFSIPQPIKSSLKKQLGLKEDDFLVGMVGVITKWKGQSEFIEMATELLKEHPSLHFVIIGSEIYDTNGESGFLDDLHLQASKAQPKEHIHFLSFQKNMEVIYPALDTLVHASTKPEPFGRVIVEAMSYQIPITASAAGGPLEIINESIDGLLHQPGNSKDMAANVAKIYQSESLRKVLKKGGLEKAKQFSLESYCSKMYQILDISNPSK